MPSSSSTPHEAISPPPPPLSSPPPTTPSSSLSSCSSSSSSSSSSCCTHRKKPQGYTTPSTYQDQTHPTSPSLTKTKMKAKNKRKMRSGRLSPHTAPRQGSNGSTSSSSITSSCPTSPVMVAGGAKPIPLSSPTSSSAAVASSSLSPLSSSSPHLLSSITKKIPALPLFSLYEHEANDNDDQDANNNDGKRNKKGGDGSNNIINKNNKSTGPTTQEETKKEEVEYDFDNDCVYCSSSSSSALPITASDDDDDDDAMDKNLQLQQQQQQGKVVTFGDGIMTTTTIAEEEEEELEEEEEVSVASSSSRNKRQRRSRICMTRIWWCLRHISCIRKLTTNFWRYLPSVLVTKAFWLSLMTLGLCDLAKIIIVSNNNDNAMDDNNKEEITMTFGLWTYSELTNVGNSSSSSDDNGGSGGSDSGTDGIGGDGGDGGYNDANMGDYNTPNNNDDDDNDDYSFYDSNNPIIKEVDRVAACHLHLGHTDSSHMFFMDPKFRTARAFGVIAVGVGFLSMVALWLGAMRSRGANSVRWRKGVGLCLILCCAFEGLTLLILRAGVCSSGGGVGHGKDGDEVYRDCSIAEGSATIISACTFWLLTGLAMVKLPPADPEEEEGEEEEEERRRGTSGEDQEQEEEADFGPYAKSNIASALRRRFFSRWSWRKWTLLRQTSYASEMVEIGPGTRSPPSYDSWSEDESIELP